MVAHGNPWINHSIAMAVQWNQALLDYNDISFHDIKFN